MSQATGTQQTTSSTPPVHKAGSATVSAAAAKAASVASRASESVSTAARSARSYASLTLNQFIAICIWLVGMFLTSKTLMQLGVTEEISAISGFVLQLALTRAEAPLWKGRGLPKMAIAAVVVDVLINSAGAWPYTKNIGATDFWTMVRDLSSDPTLQATIGTQFAFAFIAGAFTAAAAEYFWNL